MDGTKVPSHPPPLRGCPQGQGERIPPQRYALPPSLPTNLLLLDGRFFYWATTSGGRKEELAR